MSDLKYTDQPKGRYGKTLIETAGDEMLSHLLFADTYVEELLNEIEKRQLSHQMRVRVNDLRAWLVRSLEARQAWYAAEAKLEDFTSPLWRDVTETAKE